MRPIVTDITSSVVRVCMLVTRIYCAETDEPIEMPFNGLTLVCPRNQVLDGGQDRTHPFAAARGEKSAMRPIFQITLDTCYYYYYILMFFFSV